MGRLRHLNWRLYFELGNSSHVDVQVKQIPIENLSDLYHKNIKAKFE